MIRILADGDVNNGYLIGAIVALCLLILLMIINIIYTIKVNRVIARNELGITSQVHIDPSDYKGVNAIAKVVISNHNFRTINVIAFGIYYDRKLYDFIGKYAQEVSVSLDNSAKKVYINSNDSIIITLTIDEIEKIVNQTKHLKKIQIMAQDSSGHVTKKNAKTIREFIKKLRKQRELVKVDSTDLDIELDDESKEVKDDGEVELLKAIFADKTEPSENEELEDGDFDITDEIASNDEKPIKEDTSDHEDEENSDDEVDIKEDSEDVQEDDSKEEVKDYQDNE